jgi:hypothetical protein
MPKDVRRHKTIRAASRRTATQRKVRITSVKDLLAKAGLSERQVSQAHDIEGKICENVREMVGPEWAEAVLGVKLSDGVLSVATSSAGLASRLRLILETALLAGTLRLGTDLPVPKAIRVRVQR